MNAKPGKLVIVSGPSGAGKTTVVREVLQRCRRPLTLSVSATTRTPRPEERDGVDYFFLSEEEFQQRRRDGRFLECFEVFGRGCWYGTPREPVEENLRAGRWVLLEIDVQGARAAVEHFPEAVTIFVEPPGDAELERRLRGRGTEPEEVLRRRLEVARREMAASHWYRYRVINHSVDETAEEICNILSSTGE